jgi:hypothetical protein
MTVPAKLEFECSGVYKQKVITKDDTLFYLFKLWSSNEWGILLGSDAHV